MRAIVVGGGLAGITAGLRLADAGARVTVFEAKPRLGGLTTSIRHGALEVDNGQHVFLRCCTSYRALLDRLGVSTDTVLQPRLDLPVVRPADGCRGRLRRNRLPVLAGQPLHLARSLLNYRLLTIPERLAAARAVRALSALDPASPAVDARSFGDWLREHQQTASAVAALWDLIGVATLNAPADDASLALAATVFQLGLLSDPGAADIGWSAVPLSRLHGEAGLASLTAAGVEVRLRTRVRSLQPLHSDGGGRWAVMTDAGTTAADAVVLAAEATATERLLPPGAVGLAPGWSSRLGSTPIINAHFVLSAPATREPILGCVGSDLQWVFDRSRSSGLVDHHPRGQLLTASISAAGDLASLTVAELRARLVPELHRAIPAAGHVELLDFFVTREPRATWRQAPGTAADRPPQATGLPGLALAGAHTATGWPATMEGAARSGLAAADHVLAGAFRHRSEPVAA
jgi:squalene-associated FAD-dependent desaturase